MAAFFVDKSDATAPVVSFNSYTPRVAIVTGAAQGIGEAVARRLVEDGFDVAINDVSSKQEQLEKVAESLREKGRKAIAVPGDVSSEEYVKSLVEKTAEELGGVDLMVANAGIARATPFLEVPVEDFDTVYQVNIRGVFLCLKYAARQMVKQGRGGRLLAASSVAGRQGLPHTAAYSASKFAIRGMSQSASYDLRNYGITVNVYAPGYVRTPMIIEAGAVDPGIKAATETVPVTEPETIAGLVSYLARPEAYFINGQSITIDGGLQFD